MSDKTFAEGIYFNPPHEKAPEYVLGSISIRPNAFISWLEKQPENAKGYVKLSIKRSAKTGKEYMELDTWEPASRGEGPRQETRGGPSLPQDFDDNIPFARRES